MKILSRLSTISDLDFIKDKEEFINLLDGEIINDSLDEKQVARVLSRVRITSKNGQVVEKFGYFKNRKAPIGLAKFGDLYCVSTVGNDGTVAFNDSLSDKVPEKAIYKWVDDIAYYCSKNYQDGSQPRSFYIDDFKFENGKYAKLYKKFIEEVFDEVGIY